MPLSSRRAAVSALHGATLQSKPLRRSASSSTMQAHVGNATGQAATICRRKTKGIPALHWTTVHSAFGNRDRSGKKSFSTASRSATASSYCGEASRVKFIPKGLFDPTFKKDQLEADERRRDLQQRKELREHRELPVALREAESRPILSSHSRNSAGAQDFQKLNQTQFSLQGRVWKREASLAELLLSGPTFREAITHEGKCQEAGLPLKDSCTHSTSEVPLSKNYLQLQTLDITARPQLAKHMDMCRKEKRQQVQPTNLRKLQDQEFVLQTKKQACAEEKDAESGTQASNSIASENLNPSDMQQMAVHTKQARPLRTPVLHLWLAGDEAPSHSTKSSLNFTETLSLQNVVGMRTQQDFLEGPLKPSSDQATRLHEEKNLKWLNSRRQSAIKATIQDIDFLKQKVVASASPIKVKTLLPMIETRPAEKQLWLEGILVELAETLRNGPPDDTAKGIECLLTFLQQHHGAALHEVTVLQLLKHVRQRLRQNDINGSANISRGASASTVQSSQFLKQHAGKRQERSRPSTPLSGEATVHHQKTESCYVFDKSLRRFQQLCSGTVVARDLTNASAMKGLHEHLHLQQAKHSVKYDEKELKAPRGHVASPICQESQKTAATACHYQLGSLESQTFSTAHAVKWVEMCNQCFHSEKAQSQQTDSCASQQRRHGARIENSRQSSCEILGCFMRVQEAECRAAVTLQSILDQFFLDEAQQNSTLQENEKYKEKLQNSRLPHFLRAKALQKYPKVDQILRHLNAKRNASGSPYQSSKAALISGAEERILDFQRSRRDEQFTDEPLLQQKDIQKALIGLKKDWGACEYVEDEIIGIWMLHDTIVQQVLEREVKQLMICTDHATRAFVTGLLEAEAIRLAMIIQPMMPSCLSFNASAGIPEQSLEHRFSPDLSKWGNGTILT